MKTGLTIEELATEIMHQRDVKTDYIVDTTKLCMENYDTSLVLRVLGDNGTDIIEPLDIADTAHRQIGARLGIPAKYYGKMLSEHPELLATNVNAWFNKEPSQRNNGSLYSFVYISRNNAIFHFTDDDIELRRLIFFQNQPIYKRLQSTNSG